MFSSVKLQKNLLNIESVGNQRKERYKLLICLGYGRIIFLVKTINSDSKIFIVKKLKN
jgi:hypothetical protein